ncbi:MAG: Asp-tRNA(Asn)/Glu-tRNA(Gln) amidotransferase subunit GatA [Fusobacteriaceae bacterium]
MIENLLKLTAFEIREKIMKREITSEELTTLVIENIEKKDSIIGSFVNLRKEKALIEAREIDKKIALGEVVGPLAGIPVAIKDNMVSIGDPSSSCSKILEGYQGIYDATVVKKLKDAGAIIIGKTNMDEFAMGSSTKTSCYGMTKNPWDLERVPGGSSGGAASTIAAQQVFLSLGSDTGGSIRQPASFCGIVGLKPTYGRVSRYGLMAFASSLDQIGPLGKNVQDVALCMNVISGNDDYDSVSSTSPVPDFLKYLNQDIKGLKIGIPEEYFIEGLNQDIKKIVLDSIEKLEKLGAEIIKISLPHTKYAVSTYYVLAPAEASSNLGRFDGIRYGHRTTKAQNIEELYSKSRSEGFGDEVKRRIMMGTHVLSAGFFDAYFKKAQKVRALIKKDFDIAFEKIDVILTPVSPTTAFKLTDKKTPIELYLEDIFTIPANMAGLPGLVVPAGLVNGLPVGIQFLGKYFEEGTLLKVGSAFEKVRGEWILPKI